MPKVIGIGGLFFKSKNPDATNAWYASVLGIPVEPWGIFLRPKRQQAIPDQQQYSQHLKPILIISRLRTKNSCSI